MFLVWAMIMLIVFVIEPLAHGRAAAMAAHDPEGLLIRLSRVHLVLLAAGIVTIFGVLPAHANDFSDDGGAAGHACANYARPSPGLKGAARLGSS